MEDSLGIWSNSYLSGEAWENASDQFAMLGLNLIGLENGASFPDQSRSGVEIILLPWHKWNWGFLKINLSLLEEKIWKKSGKNFANVISAQVWCFSYREEEEKIFNLDSLEDLLILPWYWRHPVSPWIIEIVVLNEEKQQLKRHQNDAKLKSQRKSRWVTYSNSCSGVATE